MDTLLRPRRRLTRASWRTLTATLVSWADVRGGVERGRETTVSRVWVAGPGRLRSENLTTGPAGEERSTVVMDGDAFWLWTPSTGLVTNAGDGRSRISPGWDPVLLDPSPLLARGGGEVVGEATVAGRAGTVVRLPGRRELVLDRERGIALADTAWRDGEPVRGAAFTDLAFDVPVAPARLRLRPARGEEARRIEQA